MNVKDIEKKRYEARARYLLNNNLFTKPKNIPQYIYSPYKYYFELFHNFKKNSEVLEIGSGFGQNTLQLLELNLNVHATDISPASVDIMNRKFKNYKNFSSKVADMENLPFARNRFDIVCSAGSLSYDNNIVMNEIYRVLKPGGFVIIVDSLNNNPIYKFNRYLHYLRDNRSKDTLQRIPDIILINKYKKKFGYGDVRFFGSITWAFPLLKFILSDKLLNIFSNWLDQKFNIKKSAFKFVLKLQKTH